MRRLQERSLATPQEEPCDPGRRTLRPQGKGLAIPDKGLGMGSLRAPERGLETRGGERDDPPSREKGSETPGGGR